MKILAITPAPAWPPTHGAAVRNSHLIAALAQRHTVDVISLAPPAVTLPPQIPGVRETLQIRVRPRSAPQRIFNLLRGQTPDLIFRHQFRRFRAAVQQRLQRESYAAVHLEGLQLAALAADVRSTFAGSPGRPAVVYDAHNVEWRLQGDLARVSAGLRARYARRQATLLRAVERWVVAAVDLVIASTPADAAGLSALAEGRRVETVPHPVQVPGRRPGKRALAAQPQVLFAANFAYRPNLLSAEWLFGSVWPAVARRIPNAVLRVIGPSSDSLRSLAPVRANFGGLVDEPAREHGAAWLAVSPAAVAAGAPYKVLHAYAAGRPVVIRDSGLAGLDADARVGLVTANTTREFVDAIVDLLSDADRRDLLGTAGFRYVRETHAVPVVAARILDIYAELAARRGVEAAA